MRILLLDPWMTRIPCTSKYKLKRVSKQMEAHFPRDLREILAHQGAAALVAHLKKTKGLGLAEAWAQVKYMVNNYPT
jgi:cell wall assembly regulator SMI1